MYFMFHGGCNAIPADIKRIPIWIMTVDNFPFLLFDINTPSKRTASANQTEAVMDSKYIEFDLWIIQDIRMTKIVQPYILWCGIILMNQKLAMRSASPADMIYQSMRFPQWFWRINSPDT